MLLGRSKSLKYLLLVIVFIINTIIVLYFFRDTFPLYPWLSNQLVKVGSQITVTIDTKTKNKASSLFQPNISKHNMFGNHELEYVGKTCMDKLPKVKKKTIYSWVDGKGVRHLSDHPRRINSKTSIKIAGVIEPDAISINFLSHNVPWAIQQKVKQQVDLDVQSRLGSRGNSHP